MTHLPLEWRLHTFVYETFKEGQNIDKYHPLIQIMGYETVPVWTCNHVLNVNYLQKRLGESDTNEYKIKTFLYRETGKFKTIITSYKELHKE